MASLYYWADRLLPAPAKRALSVARKEVSHRAVRIQHTSQYSAIYHCCVQKTGSRWIKNLLSDRRTYKYSGLRHVELPRGAVTEQLAPPRAIVGPLYVPFDQFLAVPKPNPHRSFFVMRDPRDIVVSWYFSILYSHDPKPGILRHRLELERRSKSEGIIYAIEEQQRTSFAAIRSWREAATVNASAPPLVRFEDLIGPQQFEHMGSLFDACDIRMPDGKLRELLDHYSFERMSNRSPGEEDVHSKYRKGVAGDWRNHFDADVAAAFEDRVGNLPALLGYAESG